ncbi:hypothetical protein HDU98_004797, partial [Podochytrium sp. JEL0797]
MQDHTTTLDWQPVRFPTNRKDAPPCVTCLKNHNQAPYSSTTRRTHIPGQHLFRNLVEYSPMHLGRYKWYLVCYDFGSAYVMGSLIQHKDLALVEAIRCIERFGTVYSVKLKALWNRSRDFDRLFDIYTLLASPRTVLTPNKPAPTSREAIFIGTNPPSIGLFIDKLMGKQFEHRLAECKFNDNFYPSWPQLLVSPVSPPANYEVLKLMRNL